LSYSQFQIGFWHPFGPHGGERVEEILERKSRETKANGWTLWSFQRRRALDDWHREVREASPDAVYVFTPNDIEDLYVYLSDAAMEAFIAQPVEECRIVRLVSTNLLGADVQDSR